MIKRFYPLVFYALLAGCGGSEVRGSEQQVAGYRPDPRPLGKTMVYECTGAEFIARLGPREMAVWLEDRYVILSQVRSASGVRYEEGETAFWSEGETAALEWGGQRFSDCRLAPERAPWEDARRRGVDFRAVGNEPGWYLEIQRGKHLLFVADYGMLRVLRGNPVAELSGPLQVYHAGSDAQELRVEIVDGPCVDPVQGDSFPSQVIVYLDGTAFWGCGRSLDSFWE